MTEKLYIHDNGVDRLMTDAEHAEWTARVTVDGVASAVAVNVDRAKRELLATDWVENASVRAAKAVPRVSNVKDFDTYRSALRMIVITKPQKVDEWPETPKANWITE